ncbi:hypothetical protein [Helicobacter sp.]|uniref:hypothetical protein n=1 Tax=Helicobacter sp. TaxID=218 RepID=UPI0025B9DFD7|nr:hypothetical protein [Helicobacter sp.]MCI5969042.1 hypothetical protein [Helicobacter sp.]
MYSPNISEEELKAKVKEDFFSSNPQNENIKLDKAQKAILKNLDSTQIIGRIDFCVSYDSKTLFQPINFLWAEAKKGNTNDIIESFIQLIFTIKKQNILADKPLFLGAFDCEKIAFIYYGEVADIIERQTDFNWNVTPSNHNTKEFKQLYTKTKELLESKKLQFRFKEDCKALQSFIQENFTLANTKLHKVQVEQTNFIHIYYRWLNEVAPSIDIQWHKWEKNFLNADFFLADLLSENNHTESIRENLRVLLQNNFYEAKLATTQEQLEDFYYKFRFNDKQKAHTAFWNLYERPPKKEYWSFFTGRRDLLVPSNIRERKGEFFTPDIWVRKAQNYLEQALGKEFYEDYCIWDCAAGTGNLLKGLSINPAKIYASTLNPQDVADMQTSFSMQNHIFQFDFLNDNLFDKPCNTHKKGGLDSECQNCQKSKLPKSLQEILKDEAKCKKLIIFINPPYAEATTATTPAGTGENKAAVSTGNATYERYKDSMGKASNELFAQFFFRIYKEIPHCILAGFSTLKYVNSSNFIKFRETFQAKFLKGFIAPAFTFDNVNGNFPIGFLIWDLSQKE